jgi:ABC-type Na+ efflux pump permease subunit
MPPVAGACAGSPPPARRSHPPAGIAIIMLFVVIVLMIMLMIMLMIVPMIMRMTVLMESSSLCFRQKALLPHDRDQLSGIF